MTKKTPLVESRWRNSNNFGKEDGCWLEVRGKVIMDDREKDRRIVGYIRDINETKMPEEMLSEKHSQNSRQMLRKQLRLLQI